MRWQKRTAMDMPRPRVFPSLCDWLDEEVSPAWLAEFLALINLTPRIDWLLLTKRPGKWRERIDAAALASTSFHQRWLVEWLRGTPPPNVWFGVSVEDQTRANERIPILLEIPARLRWLSVEPLLGQVDMERIVVKQLAGSDMGMLNALTGRLSNMGCPCADVARINWIVIGGESGNRARTCNLRWIQNLLEQTRRAGTPTFVKQIGARPIWLDTWLWLNAGRPNDWYPRGSIVPMKVSHSKGGDPVEWPDQLRVREFPWRCIGEVDENCFGGLRNEGDS